MTVTFTLTWEEYAEQFEYSWPRRDFFPVVVTAMGALFMLVYGIALTRAIPDETFLAWIFLGGPFFLIFISVTSVISGTNKRRDQVIARAREAYERWHEKSQVFSFDSEKWVHETAAGKHESRWQAQLTTIERQNIFSLADEVASVLIPKRALSPEAIEALRGHALLSCDAGWIFETNSRDYQAALTALAWQKFRWRIIAGNIAGLAVLFWVLKSWLSSAQRSIELWGWVLAFAGLLLILGAQLWYLPLRYIMSPKNRRLPFRIKPAYEGICLSTPRGTFFFAWKRLVKFKEFRSVFLVFTDQTHSYILPKRCISPAEQAELRQRLSKNLKRD